MRIWHAASKSIDGTTSSSVRSYAVAQGRRTFNRGWRQPMPEHEARSPDGTPAAELNGEVKRYCSTDAACPKDVVPYGRVS